MGEVGRAIERDVLGEHERQDDFRSDQSLAPLLQFIGEQYRIEKSDLYLLEVIPDQFDMELLIWLWPSRWSALKSPMTDRDSRLSGGKRSRPTTRAFVITPPSSSRSSNTSP